VARTPNTHSALDELRQIQSEARRASSVEQLRECFDRIQAVRYARPDDFETQLLLSEVQEEVIARARAIRHEAAIPLIESRPAAPTPPSPRLLPDEIAEIPADIRKIDPKTIKWAFYLAAIFTVAILAAFFYLIQTARRINMTPNLAPPQQSATTPGSEKPSSATASVPGAEANTTPPKPTVRLYTDLVPGTVTIDDNPPQDLKDGELVLDNLEPGQHSIKVSGRSGNAAFTFDVSQNTAPRIIGLPTASNAVAVLVSAQDGAGRLITSADRATVYLDGQPAGDAGTDGLQLKDLGTVDHNLQVTRNKDRQLFVLTYTSAPALTVYVKSDPNVGTVVVKTGVDGASVFIDGKPYKRPTERGQLRIPLKVGEYTISVHKPGYIDPPPQTVDVQKAEEAALDFTMEPSPAVATLDVRGAAPGTMIYIDHTFAAAAGADGNATIPNVPPGDHAIELRRDQALPKRFERTFNTGDVVTLSGPDVTLDRVVTENKPAAPPPDTAPPPTNTAPAAPRRFTFVARGQVGGFFKRGKLQWYAGYLDPQNYILFTLDGKRAIVREIRDGKTYEVNKVPFSLNSDESVQIDINVKQNSIEARVKKPDSDWTDLGSVTGWGRDFTQGRVGAYKQGEQ
jgi:hypothetical protein